MVLLFEGAQVGAWFGLFGDSANLKEREVHGLHGTYHMLKKSIWTHLIELLDDVWR